MADEPGVYTINIESGNIVVRHTGKLSVRVIEAWRKEAAKLATARQLRGILVDFSRVTSSLRTVDIYDLCASQRFVLPPHAVVAVVYPPDQIPADDAEFAEAISMNRGIAFRMFTDLEAAQQWLAARRRL